MADLGRFRRGDTVRLGVVLPGRPDHAPAAVVLDADGVILGTYFLPAVTASKRCFARPLLLGEPFHLGTYSVVYRSIVDGEESVAADTFTLLPGGDSGGRVIALHQYERPEASYVLAQLDAGRLVRGKNPTL